MRPTRVDLTAAQLDERKAKADLATLLRGPVPAALTAARFAVGAALGRLFQAAGPASPVDLAAVRAELAKAQAELDTLKTTPSGPGALAVQAAQLAVTLAQQRLAELPPGSTRSEVIAAQLDLKKAQAELEALQRPGPGAIPSALAAAQAAVDLATQKLALATGPPNPATVAAAGVDLRKAKAELETLRRAAPPAAIAAARLAVALSRDRLTQLLHPTSAVRETGAADVAKAAS